jgi:FG-GAP-like repeat/Abnormal spindle-like microcephaly-assoc'd, ASPM-SPD-2-Hydin/Divergent InlB B-repeat domain
MMGMGQSATKSLFEPFLEYSQKRLALEILTCGERIMKTAWPNKSNFGARFLSVFAYALLLLIFVTGSSSAQTDTSLNGPGNVFLTANLSGPGGTGPTYLAVSDFNGDGHADVVVANAGNNTIGVLLGKGDGTFQAPVATTVACNPTWVAAGDFNGDGHEDVVVVAPACGPNVDVLLGNGNGTFTSKTTVTFSSPQTVAVGDFNGDGKLDIAVVTDGSPDTVLILLGNGDGTFKSPISVSLGATVRAYQAVVADFNKDGHVDLAISENNGGSGFLVLLGKGDGTFLAPSSFALPAQGSGLAVGDFNNDGIPDVAATTFADGGVSIFLGDGTGHFAPVNNPVSGTLPTGNAFLPGFGPTSVAIGDFNNDGKPDVVVALGFAGGSSGVSVLLGKGDGTLAPQLIFGTADTVEFVAVGDFNNDGKLDWVATTSNPVDSVSMALGRGDGTFQAARIYVADNAPAWVAFGDFNSDGVLDMLVTNQPANTIDILLGNKGGTFQAATGVPFSGSPGVVVTGDFNNDGKPDFVVRNNSSNPTTVAAYLGNGNGTFQTPKSFSTGGVNGSLMVAGDFNGDGKLDLAVSNNDAGSPNIAILLGNGDGTFGTAKVTSTGGGSLSWIAAADLNKDGHLDLIAVDNTNQDVAIFLGKGDGTFQTPSTLAQSSPIIASVGDFNNDGNPDLLVTGNGNANIYLGTGKGTFNSPLTVTLATPNAQPGLWVGVADFNVDGNLDFVVGAAPPRGQSFVYQGIRLLLGNGDGTFQAAQEYLAGQGNVLLPASVGDFNGDGAPDVAVMDFENSIMVLMNQTLALKVTLAGGGQGSVTSSPAGISCPSKCVFGFSDGTMVTLTAHAATGSVFTGWSGACSGTGMCSVTLSASESVTATFKLLFPLTVTLAGNGTGTVTSSPAGINCPTTCNATFASGTVIALTATAASGSAFAGWSGACGGTGSCSVTVSSSTSVTATFNLSTGPAVTLSPTSLSFGTVAIGVTSAGKTVTLKNTGTASLTITAIAITGTNAADFAQTHTCGSSLAVGASCTFSIKFKPTASGTRTAVLSITDSAAGSPQKVALSGVGTTAKLSPTTLNFGTVAIGVTSAAKSVTLTNVGTTALTITAIAITGTNAGDFSQTHTCVSLLGAGTSCTISIKFKPTASGARTAALSITDNAVGSPQKATLSGTGTTAKLSPTSVNFGSVSVGVTSAAKTVTLTNVGATTLTITGIAITGTNAGDFSQTHTCGSSLAAGASCTISVKFKPAATGARSAALAISDNAAGSPQKVTLSGTGQ